MTRGLRLPSWPNFFLAAYVALIGVLLFAVPAHASTPPRFSILPATTLDNAGSVTVTITKSAKASSYSKLHVFTNDGTALAGVDYGAVNKSITAANSTLTIAVPIAIIPRSGYQGTRAFTISIIPTRNGTTGSSTATVTINDSEQPPAPAPPPPSWVAAPLTAGGYARCKAVGGCHGIGAPYPPVIAQPGDVLLQMWNGVSVDDRQILALYPIGQWMVAGLGLEAYQDEWEGVAPAP